MKVLCAQQAKARGTSSTMVPRGRGRLNSPPRSAKLRSVLQGEAAMNDAPNSIRPFPLGTAIVLTVLILACAIYANLSFAVTDPVNYKYFPPFVAHSNENQNRHLGAEYLNIGKA